MTFTTTIYSCARRTDHGRKLTGSGIPRQSRASPSDLIAGCEGIAPPGTGSRWGRRGSFPLVVPAKKPASHSSMRGGLSRATYTQESCQLRHQLPVKSTPRIAPGQTRTRAKTRNFSTARKPPEIPAYPAISSLAAPIQINLEFPRTQIYVLAVSETTKI